MARIEQNVEFHKTKIKIIVYQIADDDTIVIIIIEKQKGAKVSVLQTNNEEGKELL